MKRQMTKKISVILLVFLLMVSITLGNIDVYASASTVQIEAKIYELDKNSHYQIGEKSPSESIGIGSLVASGNIRPSSKIDFISTYEVTDGNISINYSLNKEILNKDESDWHLTEDISKTVNDLTLDSDILSGAIVVQTSLDGISWTEDLIMTDIFADESKTENFYKTSDIQIQNGCYYRIFVAYKMERRLDDSKILFVNSKNYEYKQVAEVFEFYIFSEADKTNHDVTPMKKLGEKINTGKDTGYFGNIPIDIDDPHYGWDIGYFYINGYTRETETSKDVPVFLKNVGDKVSLWFHLSENINKLRGNEKLTISEDQDGYDHFFEIEKTNFEHGTLIIQYTNAQGEEQDPIIYTDFLAANALIGDNTKVQLFEEGDYKVSLNYEIKSMGGPLNALANYSNYKILFEFSIRNGNCMVYPFNIVSGSELPDNALTEEGFKLDFAKSKYLTIDVQRSILVVGTDGNLTEDVRFNRPAKDGDSYTDEGIYTFNVSNLFTGQNTQKTIYVGSSKYMRALSSTGMSIEELNSQIESGAIVHEDGVVKLISTTINNPSTESEVVTQSINSEIFTHETQTETESPNTDYEKLEETVYEANTNSSKQKNLLLILVGILAIIITFAFLIHVVKRKYTNVSK